MFDSGTRVHVVGVGGAGMSGVARLLVEKGCVVSGCDVANVAVLEELAQLGIRVAYSHDARHVHEAQVVLYSPAIQHDNVEMVAAREQGVALVPRSELLAELAKEQRVIGLTGTHGKTTATSMMVHVLHAAGRDDSRLLGAAVVGIGPNGHFGNGDLILEVDESFGSFTKLRPYALGVLNVEADHLDYYQSLAELERAFAELVERTKGPVVVFDDPGSRRSIVGASRDVIVVGTNEQSAWQVRDINLARQRAEFAMLTPFGSYDVALRVTGLHNVANAATVAALALAMGVDPLRVVEGLHAFAGVPRRFEYVGTWSDVDVYEDYAHLPSEIRATIAAAKAAGYRRIGVVFQPHRVTRTTSLAEQFAHAFDGCAALIVSDIYDAGEANPFKVTGEIIANVVRATNPGFLTSFAPTFHDVARALGALHEEFDMVVFMGAGDIADVSQLLEGGVVR